MKWNQVGAIFLFEIAKFAAYSVFCAQAPRWFAFAESNLSSFGLRWGVVRLLIGIAAGIPIVFIFSMTEHTGWPLALVYAASFVPVRYLEWFVLFKMIGWSAPLSFGMRANTWIMMGVAVSVALDLAFAWAVEAGNVNFKFFC